MWTVKFELNEPSLLDAYTEIIGLRVEVWENSTQVVVHDVDAADIDEAEEKALSTANQFLNTLSWKCNTDLKINTKASSVEFTEPSGKKHLVIRPPTVVLKGRLIAVKKDASGNIIEISDSQKPGRINVKPSDAAAYYRQAHLTDDPFDRFRNLYYATENVYDRIRMKKGLTKQELKGIYGEQPYEQNLLQLALDECFANNLHPLIETIKRIYTFDNNQSIVPQVAEILYKGLRCELSHSKASKDKKIPFNLQDEKEVETALPLMDFVAKSLLGYEETSL